MLLFTVFIFDGIKVDAIGETSFIQMNLWHLRKLSRKLDQPQWKFYFYVNKKEKKEWMKKKDKKKVKLFVGKWRVFARIKEAKDSFKRNNLCGKSSLTQNRF